MTKGGDEKTEAATLASESGGAEVHEANRETKNTELAQWDVEVLRRDEGVSLCNKMKKYYKHYHLSALVYTYMNRRRLRNQLKDTGYGEVLRSDEGKSLGNKTKNINITINLQYGLQETRKSIRDTHNATVNIKSS